MLPLRDDLGPNGLSTARPVRAGLLIHGSRRLAQTTPHPRKLHQPALLRSVPHNRFQSSFYSRPPHPLVSQVHPELRFSGTLGEGASFERTSSTNPPLQPSDIPGYFGQVVVELMPAAVELLDGRPRELLRVQREVRERHRFVIAAVIQEYR